jgi:hypothetical protein
VSDLDKLKSTIAQDPDILDVIDAASEWWVSWRDQQWVIRENGVAPTARSFVSSRLQSTDPVVYATGLMCIAMSLFRIRPGLDDVHLNLSAGPMALYDRITVAIDQVVLTQQPNGPAGILLALQRAKTHAEGDQLRKSWLRIRHAILLSQHLNFANDLEIAEDELMSRQRWVGGIYEMDHTMSMVLGFPHARDKNFTDRLAKLTVVRADVDETVRMRALRRIVAIAAARINQRNSSAGTEGDATTRAVQRDLQYYGSCLSPEWWNAEHHLDRDDMQLSHEHLMTQLWYWQVSAFLHLPEMLGAGGKDLISRDLCLHACREMLKVFNVLRGTPALSVYICSCEDFQGVVTSTMLLIGILLGISQNVYPGVDTLEADLGILEEVKDIFRYRSTMQGGSICRQGLKVIDTLESFLLEGSSPQEDGRSKSIILPYFGLIRIESQIPPLMSMRAGLEHMGLKETDQSFPTGVASHTSSDAATTTFSGSNPSQDSPVFHRDSVPTTHTSPSLQGSGWGSGIADKGLPTDGLYDHTTSMLPGEDEYHEWDQFLYGNELGQDWNLPGWDDVLATWNEDVLSHVQMP